MASKLFPSEDAFKNDQKSIEILIAGHMYKIDFEEGVQARATYKPLFLIMKFNWNKNVTRKSTKRLEICDAAG